MWLNIFINVHQLVFHTYLLTNLHILTYLLIYLLTPWSRVLEKLTTFQLVKKFPVFYGTQMFITAFISCGHLSLSWSSSIQSIPPHPTSLRSISILSFHLHLGLPVGLFPSGFPTKSLYMRASPLPIHATRPAHLAVLDFIFQTVLGEEYRSLSFSLCSFLHYPVTTSVLGPNILLHTLFSNTLSLRSSLNVNDQISHPYKTTGKIISIKPGLTWTDWYFCYILTKCLGLPSLISFPQVSQSKPCTHLSPIHAPPVFFSIWSPKQYWVWSTDQ